MVADRGGVVAGHVEVRDRGLPLGQVRDGRPLHEVAAVQEQLEARFGPPDQAALTWKPQVTVPVDDEKAETLFKLLEALDENDDVQRVIANFEVSEAALARLAG